MSRLCLASWLLVALLASAQFALAEDPQPKKPAAKEAGPEAEAKAQAERETKFAESLTGATLVGTFTMTSDEGTSTPKEEKYTLTKVAKLKGEIWLFQTRIQYGDHDVTLPLPLPVKWAGDTPMIYLDEMPIPGLGTFNARVIFSEGKYAGTWSGKDHGGHLFGRILPAAAEEKKEPAGK